VRTLARAINELEETKKPCAVKADLMHERLHIGKPKPLADAPDIKEHML
jgi:hypothetical protein